MKKNKVEKIYDTTNREYHKMPFGTKKGWLDRPEKIDKIGNNILSHLKDVYDQFEEKTSGFTNGFVSIKGNRENNDYHFIKISLCGLGKKGQERYVKSSTKTLKGRKFDPSDQMMKEIKPLIEKEGYKIIHGKQDELPEKFEGLFSSDYLEYDGFIFSKADGGHGVSETVPKSAVSPHFTLTLGFIIEKTCK